VVDPGAQNVPLSARASVPELTGQKQARHTAVARAFKIGDHVSWNSEAGRVSGTIIAVHTQAVNWKGYTHHATRDDRRYEIQSDKTDHIALHKTAALTLDDE
jgi:hypothetical protein